MEILVAVAILIGVTGIVIPVLPGILLISSAIAVWAVANGTWWLLAAVVALTAIALALKIAIPARAVRDSASKAALAVGAVAALVGFFVVPVVGAILGFLLGVLAAELVRLRQWRPAVRATWSTAKSVGLTMAVELAVSLLMTGLWVAAVLGTG
jgi:uncharacterized protein YqgC (DUF456 family)